MAGSGRGGPSGQFAERDRDGVLEVVGQAAEPGPEDDPDLRNEARSRADGGLEGVKARRPDERGSGGMEWSVIG